MPGFVVTASSSEQVTTDQLKTHLRVLTDEDDTYIGLLGTAARQYIEHYTKQAMIPKAITWYMERFPAGSETLVITDHNPLRDVVSIVYLDTDGSSQAVSTADYNIDTNSKLGRILTGQSTSWPGNVYSYTDNDNVWISLEMGHTTATCPESFRHAEKIIVKHWYTFRAPVISGTVVAEVPMTVNALLDPYVITRFK